MKLRKLRETGLIILEELLLHLKGTMIFHMALMRILKKNNLPNIRFHDIRHSVATELLNSGIDLKVIQEYLGHSTIGITANYYLHPDIKEKSKALQQINKLLQ